MEPLDGKRIEYMEIAIHKIRPSRFQTRRLHDPIQEAALRESVREHGVLEPLVVRAHPKEAGSFEIVCGHMRRKAALEAGLDMIPCMVVAISDEAAFELAMVENVARCSLNPIDEAFGYKRLLAEGIAEHQRGDQRQIKFPLDVKKKSRFEETR